MHRVDRFKTSHPYQSDTRASRNTIGVRPIANLSACGSGGLRDVQTPECECQRGVRVFVADAELVRDQCERVGGS